MSWYRTGTVTVTNGSTAVTGSGTAWVGNVIEASAIILPDGRAYEVAAIVSNTSLTLGSAYQGSTASGQSYAILPTIGWARRVVDKVAEWQTMQQAYLDGPLSGRFGNGTAGAPGVSFLSDTDTGLFRKGANQLAFTVGGTEALAITAGGLLTSPTAITQSDTDATTGRLLKVGDFGLGALATPITDLTAALAPGLYRFVGSTTTGSPTNVSTTCSIIVMSSGNAGVSQTSIVVRGAQATNNSQMWIGMRFALTGAWTWIEITTHANLLGTVSQSAGAPTGAVIERGSGANGHYTRLADGTQICWFALAAVGGAGKTWTFPAAFSAAPVVTGNAQASVLSAVCLDSAPGTTSVTFSTRDKADARRADTCHLTATGRWF